MKQDDLAPVLKRYGEMCSEYPHWRTGQCLFNALYEVYPDIADSMRGGREDPFYVNNKDQVDRCVEYIKNNY